MRGTPGPVAQRCNRVSGDYAARIQPKVVYVMSQPSLSFLTAGPRSHGSTVPGRNSADGCAFGEHTIDTDIQPYNCVPRQRDNPTQDHPYLYMRQ